VSLSWNASTGATSYNVKRSVASGSGYSVIASNISSSSYTDTAVSNGTTYYYVVSALNSVGEGANSAEVNAKPSSTPTDYLTQSFASGSNTLGFNSFTFTPSSGVNGYTLGRAVVTGFPTTPVSGTNTTLTEGDDTYATVTLNGGSTVFSGTSVTLTGTSSVYLFGSSYTKFYVGSNGYITFNSGDTQYSSSISNHFTQPRISALFGDLNVTGSSASVILTKLADRVAVTWQNVPDYNYSTSSNNFQVEMFFDGRIRITLLSVTAKNGSVVGLSRYTSQPSGFVQSNFLSYPTAPGAVAGLSAFGGDGVVSLAWNALSGATAYKVRRSTTSGTGYVTIANATSATSYSDYSVTNGTRYYYVVSGKNSVGEGASSAEAAATPHLPIPAPSGLTAMVATGTVSLSWTASAGATSYTVYRSLASGTNYFAIATGVISTSFKDNTVSNGVAYFYTVTAVNADGESSFSNEVSGTPLAAPSGVTATGSYGVVALSWNPSAGATSYKVKRSMTSGSGYAVVVTTGATSFNDTSVANWTSYYYTISAVNSTCESVNSTEVSAQPQSPAISASEQGEFSKINVLGNAGTATFKSSVVGHTYQLQYTDSLTSGSWINYGAPQSGTGADIQFSLPYDSSLRSRFYRFRISQ
jgi:filamentous hemagglutinin family protein